MGEISRKSQIKLFKLFDVVTIALSFAFAFIFTFKEGIFISPLLSLQIDIKDLLLFTILLVSWHLIFVYFRLYQSRRLGKRYQDFVDILKSTSLCCFSTIVIGFIFGTDFFHKTFILLFSCSSLNRSCEILA